MSKRQWHDALFALLLLALFVAAAIAQPLPRQHTAEEPDGVHFVIAGAPELHISGSDLVIASTTLYAGGALRILSLTLG